MVKKEKTKKIKFTIIIFVITAIVATIFTTVLAFGGTSEGYRTITVIEIQGTVGVVHNNMEYQAYTGMHLEEGYTVVTSGNSYIRMMLDDDKYVKLEAGSKAVFEEVSGGKTSIRLERGSLLSEITKPLAVDEDFVVNTPNAVLAVRGTLFRVDLSRNNKGELNTDVMTYGGAVSSKRIQPNGDIEDIEVTIKEGFKATVNMDEKETVYLVDEVKVDLSALVGNQNGDGNSDVTITETDANGEIINTTPVTLESVLKPILLEDIPDDDLVDIYFASENGHSMFVEKEQIATHIEERNIDVTQKTSVYEVAEKVENPVEIVIPDDNIPLAVLAETPKEEVQAVQGPPTDGLGTVHIHKEIIEEIKPTCTKDGKTTVKCSECNAIISETVLTTKGHTILSNVTTQPTCKNKGSRTDSCSVCGEIIAVVELAAVGHTTKTMVVNPTCTAAGKTVVSCTVCGEKISETINSATGHKAIFTGTKDSHTECEKCGEILSIQHTFKETIVKPTCTTDGGKTYSCECGYIYEEVVSASGHTTEKITVDSTCTTDGKITEICTVCDEVVSETVVEKNGHTEESTTVEPTCTEDGKTTVICTVCNEVISETVLEKKGHTEKITTVEPTCTEDGSKTTECTVCQKILETLVLPSNGHTEVNAGTDAVHIKCSVCDLPLVTEHNLQKKVNQKENCVTEGLYTYSCECGYEYNETVAASGHSEVMAGGADIHTKCETCGETLKDGTYHSYSDEIMTPNSCTTSGILTHTCSCNWSYTEEIPASHTKSADGLSCSACGGAWVDLNSANFPDSSFLTYISANFNTDPYVFDEALIGDELTDVSTIDVSGDSQTDGGYTDLTGIRNFVNLTNVNCSYNSEIEILDLSGLTGLTNLDVTGLTGLKILNISGCTNLTEDRITGLDTCTSLTEINVSGCTNISELNFNSNTKLKTVDLSNCSALTSFVINDNSKTYALQSVNLSGCSNLETLIINNALSLTTVDCSDLAAIQTIDLGGCQNVAGTLNLSNKALLATLTMGGTKVTSLNVTGCSALTEVNALACSSLSAISGIKECSSLTTLMLKGTAITSLDLNSTNQALQSLNVENCTLLTNLDLTRSTESTTFNSLSVAGCTSLKILNLYNCKGITTLDTTTLTALEELNLTYSGVTTFNGVTDTMSFSQNTSLKNVYLNGVTSFTGFALSANTLLEEFALSENTNVTSLDFSSNTKLKSLNLSDVSSLGTLDISSCTSIESLNLLNTGLTALSVTGNDSLTQFWVYNNANLESLSLTGAANLTSVKLSAGTENAVLTSLSITNSGITSLDVTNLTKLTTLDVSGCSALTSITGLNGCTELETVTTTGSGITSLDLSGNTSLSSLNIADCDSLISLNVSNTKISGLTIDDTYASLNSVTLNNVDVDTGLFSINNNNVETVTAQNINVQSFGVTSTSVTTIDLTGSTIGDGGVMAFSISGCGSSLETLNVSNTNLTTLPTETMSALKTFNAENCSGLNSIDLATMPNIENLDISGCTGITTIDVSNSTALKNFDASGCTALGDFDISSSTELVSLNVSGTAITYLDASYNQVLESIDMSDCTQLTVFAMASGEPYDQLTSVNASGCTVMTDFQIDACSSLTTLDLSGLTSLRSLYLNNCTGLTTLDVSNTAMNSLDVETCTSIASINITGTSMTSANITLPDGVTPTITGP